MRFRRVIDKGIADKVQYHRMRETPDLRINFVVECHSSFRAGRPCDACQGNIEVPWYEVHASGGHFRFITCEQCGGQAATEARGADKIEVDESVAAIKRKFVGRDGFHRAFELDEQESRALGGYIGTLEHQNKYMRRILRYKGILEMDASSQDILGRAMEIAPYVKQGEVRDG